MANSPARLTIDVGSVVAGTYTIEALIGRGGMGAVFVASHNRLPGKKVAIKVLHTDVEDAEILLRFRREAEIASRLGHPNIVAVTDFNVTAEGMPYLVLEFLQGQTLAQRIRQGPVPLEQVFSIIRQVGSALAAAHREGIVHRDLKPQNIFLVPTEVDGRIIEIAKVLDFGISKIRGSQTVQTLDNSLLGTPQYMAPEQATGQHNLVDERTDVFALGAIVYEMLCGHPAFNGASIPEVVFKVVYEQPKPLIEEAPTTPPAIVAAVQQAMAKAAGERFASVSGFVEALTGLPLAPFRGQTPSAPEVGFAAGSRHEVASQDARVSSHEAFAHTVGSGDHGPAATPHPVKPAIDASVATVDSQRQQLGTDATIAPASVRRPSAATLMDPPLADVGALTLDSISRAALVAPPPAKRPLTLLIGLALVCVTAVVIVLVVTTRGAPPLVAHAPSDAARLPTLDAVAHTSVDAMPDASVPTDATADTHRSDAAPAHDAAVIAAKPDAGRPTPLPRAAEDPEAKQALLEAEQALRVQNYPLAERQANKVINSETRSPNQKAQALAIRGIVQCLHYRSEERARYDLRAIPKGVWHTRLLKTCQATGQLTTDA